MERLLQMRRIATIAASLAVVLPALVGASPALAAGECEGCTPWWHLTAGARPTYLPAGGSGHIEIVASNLGDAEANAELNPVTITDRLPPGVRAVEVESVAGETNGTAREVLECQLGTPGEERQTVTCTFAGHARVLEPYRTIELRIAVGVAAGTSSGQENLVSVSGGGASRAVSVSPPLTIASSPGETPPFGLEDYEVTPEEPGGTADRQAGSHPFQTTLTVALNQGPQFTFGEAGEVQTEPAGGLPKDLEMKLPPGLVANPSTVPRCTPAQFQARTCPPDTVIGVANVLANEPAVAGLKSNLTAPVFNLEPSRGEPARFGFLPTRETPAFIDASVRAGGDYAITTEVRNITQVGGFLSSQVTLWGVPGDARHDGSRGYECLAGEACSPLGALAPPALLTLPTSCTNRPLESVAEVDRWEDPGQFAPVSTSQFAPMGTLVGCEGLPFEPSVDVTPDATNASAPTGLNVDVQVPQGGNESAAGRASSEIRDLTIALPAGVALNPAGANGLQACSEGLVGYLSARGVQEELLFSPTVSNPFCPDASKIGKVTIATPLLPAGQPLKGFVYLASQDANPFGRFLAVYVVAEDPVSGTLVKLPGELSLNQATGQITVTFEGTPQLPLEEIELKFFGGERALLATPARCGSYTTQASFVPWSAEAGDEAALTVHSSSTFNIATGPKTAGEPGGGPCPGASLPFAPSLQAGTASLQAGGYGPLTITVGREDGEQPLQGLALRLPPGLEGMLSSVPLCAEAQANAGACGPASQIGETTVAAGVGGDPYTLEGGRVYLTGPYEGAPFGLAIEVPVQAGPLDLEDTPENHPACDCLAIRAKIEVDPQTAQLTIATGTGAGGIGGIPNMIDGVPLQIKDLNITIDRSGFILNPTDCAPLALAGTIAGGEGASATVSTPFRVANCSNLKLAPKLTASTDGRAEALKGGTGASLNVRIASKDGPGAGGGEEANIKRVDLTLPRLLPARLQPTLQNACTKARFAKNPASCPPDSFVGTATAVTPMLDTPLIGPVILVSRGGAAPPDLDLVLQGEGVKIVLNGGTEIKGGETYVRFEAFPDAPISSFALSLPEGPHSALASGLPTNRHSLCGQSLEMPARIEGQNGAVVKRAVKVGITGCPRARLKHGARKRRKRPKKNPHQQ